MPVQGLSIHFLFFTLALKILWDQNLNCPFWGPKRIPICCISHDNSENAVIWDKYRDSYLSQGRRFKWQKNGNEFSILNWQKSPTLLEIKISIDSISAELSNDMQQQRKNISKSASNICVILNQYMNSDFFDKLTSSRCILCIITQKELLF